MQRRLSSLPLHVRKNAPVKGMPKPAKKVDHIWFVGTPVPPPLWPRRIGEDQFDDDLADHAVRCLKGDQVYVFHNDKFLSPGLLVWAFSGRWQGKSRMYTDVKDVAAVVADVTNNSTLPTLPCVVDSDEVFFICGHGNRDERCGQRGKDILDSFRSHRKRAFACSHLGGHAFAGNVVALPRGQWFSFVEEYNVTDLFEPVDDPAGRVFDRGFSW